VDEVVSLGRFPYRSSHQDEAIVLECLEQVGMAEFQNRTYTTLSGGEKQRVQFARVLAQLTNDDTKNKLLLLDEPTSALDLPHQESTLAIAAHYAKTKKHAVVVVLHDLNLAASWADRVLFLHDGKMVCEGPPHETITSENIQAIYGLDTHILPHPDTDRPVVLVRRTSSTTSAEPPTA
jgi:iron complex transport system ATP-binding protein